MYMYARFDTPNSDLTCSQMMNSFFFFFFYLWSKHPLSCNAFPEKLSPTQEVRCFICVQLQQQQRVWLKKKKWFVSMSRDKYGTFSSPENPQKFKIHC